MCGLTGAISKFLGKTDISIFDSLMVVSTLRGMDGAGIVAVTENPKKGYRSYKEKMTGADIIRNNRYTNDRNSFRMSCLMGHTRLPTSGGNTIHDVQPHEVGNVVGMHNGTMITVDGKSVKKSENDSKLLFSSIAAQGLEKTLKGSIGAMAMMWLDTKDWTLNFFRNKERYLYFGYPADGPEVIYWASELRFLRLILERELPQQEWKICAIPAYHHWVFDVRPTGAVVTLKRDVYYENIEKMDQPPPSKTPTNTAVVPHAGGHTMFKGFGSAMLYQYELDELLRKGCENCTSTGQHSDYHAKKIHFMSPKTWMCDDCYTNDDTVRSMVDTANGVKT